MSGLCLQTAANLDQEYVDYNIYVIEDGTPIAFIGDPASGLAVFDLASVQESSTFEDNGWAGTPFDLPLSDWFCLADGSPAVDAASPVHHADDDYTGEPRGAAPDVGALEL